MRSSDLQTAGIMLTVCIVVIAAYSYRGKEGFQDTVISGSSALDLTLEPKLFKIPFYIPRKRNIATRVNNVPLVLYQTWHSHEVPEGMKTAIYSLLDKNPEFDYYLYSDEDCLQFIKTNFDEDVVKAFETLKPGAFKSDLWRYCMLYKKGGVYLDIKYMSTGSLMNIVSEYPEIYVKDVWPDCRCEEAIYNAFMASPPGNEIFNDCIKDIVNSTQNKLYQRNVLDVTGPCLLGRMLQKYKPTAFLENNPFQFVKYVDGPNVDGIKLNGGLILKQYKTYRLEQKYFQKTERYGDLYMAQNIYN
jgi:mannosyltransferase OCH1-like enzyme